MKTATKICSIVSGGPWYGVDALPSGYVIACDRGYAHACRMHLVPDLVIGDFDSFTGAIAPDIPVITLPTHKDDTDTGYAIDYALCHGYTDIRVYFALGGRLDHTMANIQSAAGAARRGAKVALYGQDAVLYALCRGDLSLPVHRGQALSVLALGDACHDVTIEGAAYPLAHATLTNTYPLGVSNEADGEVHIAVGEGVLGVIVEYKAD